MQDGSNQCSTESEEGDLCLCPLEGIIEIISRKWALQIIGVIGNQGKLRFNEIIKRLDKISPKALTDRLKELKTIGLIKRKMFAEIPPRVEYSLTKDGIELRKLITPLMKWASAKDDKQRV